jgi:hypothetical protein
MKKLVIGSLMLLGLTILLIIVAYFAAIHKPIIVMIGLFGIGYYIGPYGKTTRKNEIIYD